jgi:Ser/Thr protein kinase RdoA (MazF antagonist)
MTEPSKFDDSEFGPTVRRAVESIFGTETFDARPLPFGQVNRVYKVETPDLPLVVKIFTYEGWPEEGKLPWLERQLTASAIPHPRLLHYSRDGRFFPHGLAVFEYVEGRNCMEAFGAGELTAADYCRLAGEFLRRVHSIRLERHGYIGHGAGTDDDYVECKLTYDVSDRLREIGDDIYARLFPPIAEKVERLLRPLEGRFTPRLLHGDAFPRNALLTGERRLILTDWDEAMFGIWPEDLSRLSYWFVHPNPGRGDAGLTGEQVIDFFLRGYGETEFTREELARIVRALHMVYSADLLCHRHQTNNAESFKRILKVLEELLAVSC